MREARTTADTLFGAKKVNVVGHHHVSADEPPVALFGTAPFFTQNVDRMGIIQKGLSVLSAYGDEIDGVRQPNSIQSAKMGPLLHVFERSVNEDRGSMILDVIFRVLNCRRAR